MQSSSRTSLVEIDGCVFLAEQVMGSFGYEELDAVGREAFVNHMHFDGLDHEEQARSLVSDIIVALKEGWPGRRFRVYLESERTESVVRFHMVRQSEPNWYDSGLDEIEVVEVHT